MRHSSFARTRGGKRPASLARSISQSGWAYEPTSVVGRSMDSSPWRSNGLNAALTSILPASAFTDKARAVQASGAQARNHGHYLVLVDVSRGAHANLPPASQHAHTVRP